ncbi:MAG: hypothetical protein NVS3B17_22610 [Vulcanimicrobiaceae bacterium]
MLVRLRSISAIAALLFANAVASTPARAATSPHAACIDTSSPTAALDRRVLAAAARAAGTSSNVYEFDGTLGVSDRLFRFLMREHCSLIMGFPVDQRDADPPRGLALTSSYYETGYVLVGYRKALTVAQIPKNSSVAVGLGTVPNFYLVGALGEAPPLRAEAFQSQNEAIDSLVRGRVAAAMLWEPSVIAYEAKHATPLVITPLHIDHARWHLAALYDPKAARAAKTFERGLSLLAASGKLARLTTLSVRK